MDTTRKALFTDNAMMLCYGVSAILIGPALPSIIRDFSLSLPQAGLVAAVQNAGGLAGAVAAMLIADRVLRSRAAVLSFLLLSLTLIAAGSAPGYLWLLGALAVGGFAIRVLDVMLNAHVGSVAGEGRGRAMNLLHMFFSIGAFFGPLLVRLLFGLGADWARLFRLIGAAYLLLMLIARGRLTEYIGSEPPPAGYGTGMKGGGRSVRRRAAAGLLGLLLFFYAVHQVGVSSWLPQYLESAGVDPDLAAAGLSFYWVGIITGRLLTARLADKTETLVLLGGGAALSGLLTLAGVLLPGTLLLPLLWAGAGCASGATIPLAYGYAYRILPQRLGAVTSFLAVVMLLGRFCGPWLIGVGAGNRTLNEAMLIPAAALGLVALLALLVRAAGGAGNPSP